MIGENVAPAGRDRRDRVDKLGKWCVLDNVAAGTGLQCREKILLRLASREQDHARLWRDRADLLDHLEAGEPRHEHIQEHEIRLK